MGTSGYRWALGAGTYGGAISAIKYSNGLTKSCSSSSKSKSGPGALKLQGPPDAALLIPLIIITQIT